MAILYGSMERFIYVIMDPTEGVKKTLNTSKVCTPIFSFYAKDPNVKLSLACLIALVVNSDSTKRMPPACWELIIAMFCSLKDSGSIVNMTITTPSLRQHFK
nr:hypothetical protein Iba_chr10fCG9430 [Ipomoea batatas]